MKNFLPKILFYYSAIASFFIAVSLVLTSQTTIPIVFSALFLPVAAYFIIEFFNQIRSRSDETVLPKKGDAIILSIIFLALVGVGIKNIYTNSNAKEANQPVPSSSSLIFKVSASPVASPSATLTITITDGSPSINIRKEATIYSDKVGEAKNGEIFTFTDKTTDWYQILMPDKSKGFVASKYAKENTK